MQWSVSVFLAFYLKIISQNSPDNSAVRYGVDGNGYSPNVLTDFGIAMIEGDPSLTWTGVVMGAPAYTSRERAGMARRCPPRT